MRLSRGIAPYALTVDLSFEEAMAVLDQNSASPEVRLRAMQKLKIIHEQVLEKDNDA